MRRKLGATALVLLAATSLWIEHIRARPELANPSSEELRGRVPASYGNGGNGLVSESEPGAFRFTRRVRASMGSRELVRLKLQGRLWVRPEGIFVKTDSPALPLVKVNPKTLKFLSSPAAKENMRAAARFARDLIDQYRFFESSDLQGRYEARFVKQDDSHFVKNKVRYLDAPYSTAQILFSSHALAPGRVEGAETVVLGADQFSIRSETSYRIQADASLVDGSLEHRDAAWVEMKASDLTAASAQGFVRRQGVPALSWLLARLKSGRLRNGAERMGWYRDCVKRLEMEPGRLEPVRQTLGQLRASPEDFKLLVGALASAEKKDAAAILIDTYRDGSYRRQERAMVMNAWITTDVPLARETTDFLAQIASDPNSDPGQVSNALLGLGAQVAKSPDPRIVALLIEKLTQAHTEADTLGALDAMGNAGAPDFLPYIQGYLANADDHTRARAYLALRFIPGSPTDALLSSGRTDPASEVKSSVALALNLRDR